MKEYQILEDSIIVGRFQLQFDRDEAFKEYFIKTNRNGFKRDVEV